MVLARFKVRHYPTFQGVTRFFFTFLIIYLRRNALSYSDLIRPPFSGDYKKLKGGDGCRRRVDSYRILFDVDTDLRLVSVFGILPRGGV
jgi:mRNA-degrading endonuclease RelE of RelBE toxin-antitoxin system